LPDEFLVLCEDLTPHYGNFLRRVSESCPKAECPDAEPLVSIMYGDSQGRDDLISHELFLLFEGVLLAGIVELWSFHWTD